MTPQRWAELETAVTPELTSDERAEGWHFCPDWDYMLIGPDMPKEMECCLCKPK